MSNVTKEYHIGIVTRNIEKAAGFTNEEKTAAVSSDALAGAVYFKAETLYEGEYPLPAEPSFPFASWDGAGWFFTPKVGDTVLIEIDQSLDIPAPRVVCMLYTNIRKIDEEFKTHYPWRMGFISTSGHKLIFDDMEDEWMMKIEHTFGGGIVWDKNGNTIETIKHDKIEQLVGKKIQEFKQLNQQDYLGDDTTTISKDKNYTVKGNYNQTVKGEHNLTVETLLKSDIASLEETIGNKKQVITGGADITIDGGKNEKIGGCLGQSIVSNKSTTVAGKESKMVAQEAETTYGMGHKETIATMNKEFQVLLGDFIVSLVAGSFNLEALAGACALKNLMGGFEIDMTGALKAANMLGGLEVDVAGMATLKGTMQILGSQAGMIVTTATAPVIDNITGAPQMGVFTAWAG